MKQLVYPRRKHGRRAQARRVRNMSRFLGQKRVRTKVRFCVHCPDITRRFER